jgi:hypothetical protein
MRSARLALCTLALLVVAACSATIPVALPYGAPVTVRGLSGLPERTLRPGTPAHAKLAAWLDANESGWTPYLATMPANTVSVFGPGLDLHVWGSRALLRTPDSILEKSIDANEFAFLVAE